MGSARQRIGGPVLLLLLSLAALAALVACREPPAGRAAAPAATVATAAGVVRLLDRLDDAAVLPGVPRAEGGELLHSFDASAPAAVEPRFIARLRARDTARLRLRARPLDRAAGLVV